MARPVYKPDVRYDYYRQSKYSHNIRPAVRRTSKKQLKKRVHPLAVIFQLIFAFFFVMQVAPLYMDQVTRPLFVRTPKYPALKVDYNQFYSPTSSYLANNHFLGINLLSSTELKKPQMQSLYETYHMTDLENNLKFMAASHPALKPSIYVWDYESGKHADLNADDIYPTASIIKIPVLIQLFKAIEAGMIKLDDKIAMTDYYKSEGSGSLQFKGDNAVYSVDELARVMITESDNSATNMLMDATGGMNAMNQSLRKWGMKHTRLNDWLPDLSGTNVTTSKEMATMLYNIDNPNFLTLNSREKMVDYMSHVHNNRLVQAGLPSSAIFIHKTGDIGKMLGDAGIVYTPNGKKYIVVMLVNRPYNSPEGKDFIVAASSLIYNYMINANL
ncbi:MAG: serine hydrolase [Clostridium sp.]|nr:serine hydrolase [Clostridium sp.]